MATLARRDRQVGEETEGALLAAAVGGDRAAAQELLLRHQVLVYRVCRNLLPRDQDVEAVVQETFLRALKKLHAFAGAGSFQSWIVAIAVNLCRDRLRRRRLVPFVPLETPDEDGPDPISRLEARSPDPERVAMVRQAASLVRREVQRLPLRQREVFTLRFFADLGLEDIAAALGVDVGTVKTHLHRAVHRVRAAVEEAMP
jgi:RNA polymerase sigma factor (sigma-70 family)